MIPLHPPLPWIEQCLNYPPSKSFEPKKGLQRLCGNHNIGLQEQLGQKYTWKVPDRANQALHHLHPFTVIVMFNYPKYYSYVFFIHAAILMYIDITVLRFKGASIHRNPQLCSALRNFSSGCDVRCHGSGSISESTTTRTTLRCVFDILHVQFTGAYLQILQTTVLEPNVNGL